MNTPIPEDTLATIKEALFQGRKIEAIKIHRGATGAGLAEAKAAIEELEKELRTSAPKKFASPTEARGCFGVFVAVIAIVAILMLCIIAK